jgi:hypothetical protein
MKVTKMAKTLTRLANPLTNLQISLIRHYTHAQKASKYILSSVLEYSALD